MWARADPIAVFHATQDAVMCVPHVAARRAVPHAAPVASARRLERYRSPTTSMIPTIDLESLATKTHAMTHAMTNLAEATAPTARVTDGIRPSRAIAERSAMRERNRLHPEPGAQEVRSVPAIRTEQHHRHSVRKQIPEALARTEDSMVAELAASTTNLGFPRTEAGIVLHPTMLVPRTANTVPKSPRLRRRLKNQVRQRQLAEAIQSPEAVRHLAMVPSPEQRQRLATQPQLGIFCPRT